MSFATVHKNCPFCSSGAYTLYDEEGDWFIVKCNSCGFIFTNPQPSPEDLPKFYEESYFSDKRHRAKFYNEDGSKKTTNESYTNRIEDVEHYRNQRGHVLEIGSARGGFLQVLKDRGWLVQGVEISEDAAKIANENDIDTFPGVYEDFTSEQLFDVICMYQTLEHVPDPKSIIQKAKENLADQGLLIIEVPNIECSELKVNKERKHLSYDLPRHLNHFSPSYLATRLKEDGFEILEIDYYPPKFVLKALNKLSRKKNTGQNIPASVTINDDSTTKMNVPMARKNFGSKNKIIKFISRIFPGWRFTITARINRGV